MLYFQRLFAAVFNNRLLRTPGQCNVEHAKHIYPLQIRNDQYN